MWKRGLRSYDPYNPYPEGDEPGGWDRLPGPRAVFLPNSPKPGRTSIGKTSLATASMLPETLSSTRCFPLCRKITSFESPPSAPSTLRGGGSWWQRPTAGRKGVPPAGHSAGPEGFGRPLPDVEVVFAVHRNP